MKRAALYVRVSTANKSRQGDAVNFDQGPEVQEQPLRDLVGQRGWGLHRVYSDRASGAKERRAGLDDLMRDARRGEFDVVVVWRFDRFARSVKQLVLALEEFHSLGIDFVSHQEALDTSTPMGKAMFTIIAAMAELERSVIRVGSRNPMMPCNQRLAATGQPGSWDVAIHATTVSSCPNSSSQSWRQSACSSAVEAILPSRFSHCDSRSRCSSGSGRVQS
jgi:predicted site-specific integrase-resolvase